MPCLPVAKGNYLHDGNIRGMLVNSKDLTIENNVIERITNETD